MNAAPAIPAKAAPLLLAITDFESRGAEATFAMADAVCGGARAGTVAVVLRDKQAPTRQRLQWAERLRALVDGWGQHLLVADRVDLALLSSAHGVHLGEASVRAEAARRLMPRAWFTRVWHAGTEPAMDADALLLSPAMAPRKGRQALSVVGVAQHLSEAPNRVVFALGGVRAEHVVALLDAGCRGVAAIGAAYEQPLRLVGALGIGRG